MNRENLMSRLARPAVIAASIVALSTLALAGCGSSSSSSSTSSTSDDAAISVVSREEGSGTRGAFVELTGVEENKEDKTISTAVVANSTSVVATTVAGDANAIGYISLGSLDDTVKAVNVDGVKPSEETVSDGTYKVSRPFNIVKPTTLSEGGKDFLAFIMSPDGQKVVQDNGYVQVTEGVADYTASGFSGTITVSGSSSVTPVMEKLAEAYKQKNPDANVEVQQSDSSTGVQNAINNVSDLGMASRDLKDSEKSSGVESVAIARDGIAIIVNKGNSITNLTLDQIKQIYTGDITKWSEVK
ncbi:substrate-binding domain-containing protein [Alloscardovia criceti]|uniref:substrate-binding domain-containing protein n=1 Tax=Alloscardovia criceti TaxID=356828 RepID=UPI000379FB61|nr:substrate-binding domain-containing protein [Alloscardovia criceti]